MVEGRAGFFDTVAELYDAYRPSYPIEAVMATYARAMCEGPVLEIGSGTGRFTERLVDVAGSITCVEPGANLIEVARRKFDDKVSFVCSTWNGAEVQSEFYSACFSAQAFHWVGPAGFPKVHRALKPGGVFAMVWNSDRTEGGDFKELLDPIWKKYSPNDLLTPSPSSRDECRVALAASPLFEAFSADDFPWKQAYTTSEYLALLATYSDVGSMPPAKQADFLGEIGAVVEAQGGHFVKPYICRVFSAISL